MKAENNLRRLSNRQILIQLFRKVTKIERLIGLKHDQVLSKLGKKLDRSSNRLAKSVAANQSGAQPKKGNKTYG